MSGATASGVSPSDPTDRELFERVRTHLLTQGRRALSAMTKSCRYRMAATEAMGGRYGEGNAFLRCAVGCLVSDAAYAQHGAGMENESLDHSIVRDALRESGVPIDRTETWRMLSTLQSLHDGLGPAVWRDVLAELERRFLDPVNGSWTAESGTFLSPDGRVLP